MDTSLNVLMPEISHQFFYFSSMIGTSGASAAVAAVAIAAFFDASEAAQNDIRGNVTAREGRACEGDFVTMSCQAGTTISVRPSALIRP